MGRDHTLYALEPGYLKFYISEYAFPHQTPPRMLSQSLREVAKPGTIDNGDRPIKRAGSSKSWPDVNMPRGMRRFVGIVRDKADVLPRDERQEGRERRFWGVNTRASEADDTLPF
jgi:large subunit ribosomal protein L27